MTCMRFASGFSEDYDWSSETSKDSAQHPWRRWQFPVARSIQDSPSCVSHTRKLWQMPAYES